MNPLQWSVLLLLLSGCSEPAPERTKEPSNAREERIVEEDPNWLDNLHEVEVLGELPARNKSAFKVMRARGCTECDANLSIYVYSPSDGPVGPEHEQVRYPYPGALIDPFEGDTLMRTRTFLGEIAPDMQGLWWHLEQPDEHGQWYAITYLLATVGDTIQGFSEGPSLAQMEAWTAEGRVQELTGMDQVAEP